MEVGMDHVAVIVLALINTLNVSIFTKLKEKIEEALSRDDVKVIVLIVNQKDFYGEFDITNFLEALRTKNSSLLPDVSGLVLNTIEDAKKPIVAGINGPLLGVGLEVTMGCHGRVSIPEAEFGLPELKLAIIPGAGGTQRLVRLLGLQTAIDMMLTSQPIPSEEGKKLGLVDAIAPADELVKECTQLALDIVEKRRPWVLSIDKTDKIGSASDAEQIIQAARDKYNNTMPDNQYKALCLDVVKVGIAQGGRHGLIEEAKVFKKLVVADEAISRFYASKLFSKKSRL